MVVKKGGSTEQNCHVDVKFKHVDDKHISRNNYHSSFVSPLLLSLQEAVTNSSLMANNLEGFFRNLEVRLC